MAEGDNRVVSAEELAQMQAGMDAVGERYASNNIGEVLEKVQEDLNNFYQQQLEEYNKTSRAPAIALTSNEDIRRTIEEAYANEDRESLLADGKQGEKREQFLEKVNKKEEEYIIKRKQLCEDASRLALTWKEYLVEQQNKIQELEEALKQEREDWVQKKEELETTLINEQDAIAHADPVTPEQQAAYDAAKEALEEHVDTESALQDKEAVIQTLKDNFKEIESKIKEQLEKFDQDFKKEIQDVGVENFSEYANKKLEREEQQRKNKSQQNKDGKKDPTPKDDKKDENGDPTNKDEKKDEKGNDKKTDTKAQQPVVGGVYPTAAGNEEMEQEEDPLPISAEDVSRGASLSDIIYNIMRTKSPKIITQLLRGKGAAELDQVLRNKNLGFLQRREIKQNMQYSLDQPDPARFEEVMDHIFGPNNSYKELYDVLPEIENGLKDLDEEDLKTVEALTNEIENKMEREALDEHQMRDYEEVLGDFLSKGYVLYQLDENSIGSRVKGFFTNMKNRTEAKNKKAICNNIGKANAQKGVHAYQKVTKKTRGDDLYATLGNLVNNEKEVVSKEESRGSFEKHYEANTREDR